MLKIFFEWLLFLIYIRGAHSYSAMSNVVNFVICESLSTSMRMSIYTYTFDFDTFKNDNFKSVIFRLNDYLDHFDTFKNDTFENI